MCIAYLQQFTPPIVYYKVIHLRPFSSFNPAKVREAKVLKKDEGANAADQVEETRNNGVAQDIGNGGA